MARMFGTDGVRGIANEELTPLLAMQLGQAGAYVLTKENEHKPTIMVGCDTRISGDMLANALMAGACSVGANCVYVGVIPTPAVAYLTKKYKVDAGVVISASHNPVEFNGIKFFDGNGYKLPDAMEDEIEALIRNNMPGIKFPIGPGVGKIKYRTDAREEYINHAMRAVNVDLTGLKIVVDCAEGASFYTSVECLKELGGSVVAIHNNPDGTNINANCGSTHIEVLQKYVVENGLDVGFAYDGDADRCIAVDHKGNIIDGDKILFAVYSADNAYIITLPVYGQITRHCYSFKNIHLFVIYGIDSRAAYFSNYGNLIVYQPDSHDGTLFQVAFQFPHNQFRGFLSSHSAYFQSAEHRKNYFPLIIHQIVLQGRL